MEVQGAILLVEDNRATAELIHFNLSRAGFRVTVAHSGQEAIELVQGDRFDVIITDYMMPGMNGEELSRKIRQFPLCADVPIFLMSAKTYEMDRSERDELPYDKVLVKPVSSTELVSTLRATLHAIRIRC